MFSKNHIQVTEHQGVKGKRKSEKYPEKEKEIHLQREKVTMPSDVTLTTRKIRRKLEEKLEKITSSLKFYSQPKFYSRVKAMIFSEIRGLGKMYKSHS